MIYGTTQFLVGPISSWKWPLYIHKHLPTFNFKMYVFHAFFHFTHLKVILTVLRSSQLPEHHPSRRFRLSPLSSDVQWGELKLPKHYLYFYPNPTRAGQSRFSDPPPSERETRPHGAAAPKCWSKYTTNRNRKKFKIFYDIIKLLFIC